MSTTRVGDKVDIVIKGAEVVGVEEATASTQRIYFRHNGAYQPGRSHVFTGDDDIEVTVVEKPKPEWWPPQRGDVVGWGGIAWIRRAFDHEWMASPGGKIDDEQVLDLVSKGEATLLVRAGEAVAG